MIVQGFGAQWEIISQAPDIASGTKKHYAEKYWLPELVKAWSSIEKVTGYRWRCTSYWRYSPSHKEGYALDIAPDISPLSWDAYSGHRGSDPVLYKREKLIRDLQNLNSLGQTSIYNIGVYIEPDHLHLHVLQKERKSKYRIFKWKIEKPLYSDTKRRYNMPLITTGM